MSHAPETSAKPATPNAEAPDVDLSLLEDSLAMTPWERMQANDDAVNFADALHAALQRHHAKSNPIDPPSD